MFTQEQIKILQDFGFIKINMGAYKYQNLIIFVFDHTFIITYAGDRTLVSEDFSTFDDALKFIEEFGFLLFTKKEVEILTELGFSRMEDNKFSRFTGKYRMVIFRHENFFVLSYRNDDWSNRQTFKTFAETADFIKTLN